MSDLLRIRVELGGAGVVGPGLMTFYATSPATGLPAATVAFLNGIKSNVPDDVTFTVPSSGDRIDDATGALTGSWSGSGGATVTGTDIRQFALGQGARIRWTTGGIVAGRRVRGQTFIVPISGFCFTTGGRVDPAVITAFDTAAQTFLTDMAGALAVWSRPVTGRAGTSHVITHGSTSSTPTALRSRRY